MAFQKGVAQIVHVATLDGAEPTAPTNPVVTVSEDNGATFGAPDNAAVTRAYGISLTLSATETNRDLVLVRVASDNCDTALAAFWFEADWTAARATNLDAAVSSRSTLAAGAAMTLTAAYDAAKAAAPAGAQMDLVNAPNATAITAIQAGLSTLTAAQVWAYSTRTLSSLGTLVADIATAVWAAATRTLTQSIGAVTITSGGANVVDGQLRIEVPRGDSYSLVLTATDADGVAVDLSSYNVHKFTVKAAEYRGDATDANKLFQVTGTWSGAWNNVLTFALTPAQTVLGDLDVWYDCDVESSNTGRTLVRTVLIGRYRSTLDVTRGS
jgi:hypothetical protein